jgi:cell wall assembly regulator SMI1
MARRGGIEAERAEHAFAAGRSLRIGSGVDRRVDPAAGTRPDALRTMGNDMTEHLVLREFARLRSQLMDLTQRWSPQPPITPRDLETVKRATGGNLPSDLRSLYELSNGSADESWFFLVTDELTPCSFLSIPEIVAFYAQSADLFDTSGAAIQDSDRIEWRGMRLNSDRRLQPAFWNPAWIPFAQFNGGSTLVYVDQAPGPEGNRDQIIAYQHDPDAVYWIATDFLSFFTSSNDRLATNGKDFFKI